ncbi:MAG: rod shape-determining protein MreC [Candidatus Omnitrophica bacterium]|nr:rod shape-determining protein MreC [Candidatus Omnitrophota bacterium]
MEFSLKAATRSARGIYNLAAFKNRYEKKIAFLEEQAGQLKKTAVQMKEAAEENERLRRLLAFKNSLAAGAIAAEVIGRDQSSWDTFIIIDKGRKEGIVQNMSVSKNDGLVGKVYETGEGVSKVMLIDNPNSKIGAVVQRTREQGILTGMGHGLCKLIYLSYDTGIKPGDVVIAAKSGGLASNGILIGEVVKVSKDVRSLYSTAVVRPSSNLFKIEEVICTE